MGWSHSKVTFMGTTRKEGGVTSTTSMDWLRMASFPEASVAVNVRVQTPDPSQTPGSHVRSTETSAVWLQPSSASANVVSNGSVQVMVWSSGKLVQTGAALSTTVKVCACTLTLSQSSEAMNVNTTS